MPDYVFFTPSGPPPWPIERIRRCAPDRARIGIAAKVECIEVPFVSESIDETHAVGADRKLVPKPTPTIAPKTVEQLRAEALASVDAIAAKQVRVADPRSDGIRRIHEAKVAEARLIEGGAKIATPILSAESARGGEAALQKLAREVIVRASAVDEAIAAIEARRQTAQAVIRGADDPAVMDRAVSEMKSAAPMRGPVAPVRYSPT